MPALSFRRGGQPGLRAADGGARFALACARHLHEAVDRLTPEAVALADWAQRNAPSLRIPGDLLPPEAETTRRRRDGVSAEDWQSLGMGLTAAWMQPAGITFVAEWVSALASRLQLPLCDQAVLTLVLSYKLEQRTERLFDALRDCRGGEETMTRDPDLFALLLGFPAAEIAIALSGEGKLIASGLLKIRNHGRLDCLDHLENLLRRGVAAGDVSSQLLGPAIPAKLGWDDFSHLGMEGETASRLLSAALAGQERGINILLYGPPGTGKTSFAATLAARIGAKLRAVTEVDDDGGEPTRHERLSGLRLAQRLAGPSTVLLFDEAEDLFTERMHGESDSPATSRVFMHRLLEGMVVPTIWTANDIGALGPAVLRRMTMCLELRVPGLQTRSRLWQRQAIAEGLSLSDADARTLAGLVPAAPAVAATALRATRLTGGTAETTKLVVGGIARAVRGGALPPPDVASGSLYNSGLLNTDCDLAALEADLTRKGATQAVSFLLHGPPGAGKTAWVRHLAERMGLPVLQKRASDIFAPFVGESERNIANAFAEAREMPAFLVFDEADSLLLDRADATRGWEISQVNEMLTWMESHPLPFACTTNLLDRMDRASLRRFLIKIRFSWLHPAQACNAFRQFFGTAAPAGLERLTTLTPADFALVSRRAALRSEPPSPAVLLRLLAAECEGRAGARLPIGFGPEENAA